MKQFRNTSAVLKTYIREQPWPPPLPPWSGGSSPPSNVLLCLVLPAGLSDPPSAPKPNMALYPLSSGPNWVNLDHIDVHTNSWSFNKHKEFPMNSGIFECSNDITRPYTTLNSLIGPTEVTKHCNSSGIPVAIVIRKQMRDYHMALGKRFKGGRGQEGVGSRILFF